jgi:hypothetical protein
MGGEKGLVRHYPYFSKEEFRKNTDRHGRARADGRDGPAISHFIFEIGLARASSLGRCETFVPLRGTNSFRRFPSGSNQSGSNGRHYLYFEHFQQSSGH